MVFTKALTLLFALSLIGCATTIKDYKATSLKPDEGTIIGKVKVVYNGKEYSDQCSVCFNTVNGPCYKLDKSGLVVMKIKAGPTSIRRIACLDTSEHHQHMKGADFMVEAGVNNYFGDVVFDWANAGGFKVSTMFGLVGALADQSTNDGTIKMKVHSDPKGAATAYGEVVGKSAKATVKTSLVKTIQ